MMASLRASNLFSLSVRRRVSIAFAVLSILMLAAYLFFLQTNREHLTPVNVLSAEQFATVLTFSFLGALLTYRRPDNLISWIFLLMGLLRLLVYLNSAVSIGLSAGAEPVFGLLLFGFLSPWLSGFTFSLQAFLIVLFPTGRLPSARWRPVVGLMVLLGLLNLLFAAIMAGDLLDFFREATVIPDDIAGLLRGAGARAGFLPHIRIAPAVTSLLISANLVFLSSLLLLGLAAQVQRFRKGDRVHRQQVKWVLYAVALWALTIGLQFFLDIPSLEQVFQALFLFGTASVPVAITIAILRYGLFDIDIIIRRTLQYAILTGTLALVYFGAVVLLQSLFDSLTGQADSPLVTVISTLAIAGVFNPLRTHIQDFIDRRFYRRKFDSEQALARFSAAARDEVDLENISGALLGVVNETLQPEGASLWLRPVRNLLTRRRKKG